MLLKEHFKSRGFIKGGIVSNEKHEFLDMEVLPPFLRTLMVTDGTVTKSLEAFFWEKIRVECRWQEQVWLTEALPLLDANAGEFAIKRDVILQGCDSQDIYAYATSYLLTDILGDEIKRQMIEGKIGIGELLREMGLESYREIVDFGREMYRTNEKDEGEPQYAEVIYRTYVICLSGKPAIQITERFPCRVFLRKTSQ